MPSAGNIKQITLPNGSVYDLVDQGARDLIEELEAYSDYLGVTTTALADGSTTNPITINGESITAVKGNIANYGAKEFIFNGTAWNEFGDLSALGNLAFEDTAEVTGTAAAQVFTGTATTIDSTGTAAAQTFTGTEATIASSATYTPAGSVSLTSTAQTVVSGVDPTTATIKEFDDAGSVTAGSAASFSQGVDTFTASVENEVLTLDFSQGTDSFTANTPTAVSLPTSKDTTVVTNVAATSGTMDIPSSATFTGTEATIASEATYTPAGTNASSAVSTTSESYTPAGTNASSAVTGTAAPAE